MLQLDPHPRIGIAAQTTQSIEQGAAPGRADSTAIPSIRRPLHRHRVSADKAAPEAAIDLARQCDVVIVVGGANSNNTRELVNTCRRSLFARAPRPDGVGPSSRMVREAQVRWASPPARRRRTTSIDRVERAHPRACRRRTDATSHVRTVASHDDASCRARETLAARRRVCHRAWRGSKPPASTTFASWSIASSRIRTNPLPMRGAPRTGGARARGGDARDAADGRHARRTNVAAHDWVTRPIAFGVWDIFYYVFLQHHLVTGRRRCSTGTSSFLLPLPWWGPVLAPVSIAVLMIVWGTFVTQVAESTIQPPPLTPTCVAPQRSRYRARALRVHGRFASRGTARARRDENRAADRRSTGRCSALALTLMAAPVAHTGWRASRRRE